MNTRKELKEAYKNQKFPMGVFQIRNKANGKIFIESSANLDTIWNRHRFQLQMGGHPNAELQKDWNQTGEENFVFEILEEIRQEGGTTADYTQEIKTLAEMLMETLQPYGEKGYHKKPNK